MFICFGISCKIFTRAPSSEEPFPPSAMTGSAASAAAGKADGAGAAGTGSAGVGAGATGAPLEGLAGAPLDSPTSSFSTSPGSVVAKDSLSESWIDWQENKSYYSPTRCLSHCCKR